MLKRTLGFVGSLMILGLGFAIAQDESQAKVRSEIRNEVRSEVQTKAQERIRNRVLYVDENGDGICDFARDHDNDGIPNGQDPDWTKPQDGTGYMNRHEFRNSTHYGQGWNKASFRNNAASFGKGLLGSGACKAKAAKNGKS